MLDSFRALGSNFLAKILLALLVLSFAIWGIGDMVRQPGRNQAVATVGSSSISVNEFNHAYRGELDHMREMLGDNFSPEAMKDMRLPTKVLKMLIDQRLLQLEAQALGLNPGDADVVRRIRANLMFTDSKGNFDKGRFEAMLRNTNQTEKNYIDQLRRDIATRLLVETLSNAAPVSDAAALALLQVREEQRTVALYRLSLSQAGNVPSPSPKDIEAYYHDHQSEFTAPEYRTVSYITITAADVHDKGPSEERLKAMYQDRLEEFRHPEQRRVEQLLYSSKEKAEAAAAMLNSGKSLEQVAKETDPLNKKSLSLGKVEHDKVLEAAADAVFALPVGGHTDPIQSPFGWHIFHVSAIEPPSVTPFEEVRPTLEKELKQHGADDALNQLANKIEDALAGGATLKEAAADAGLKVQNVGPFNHDGINPSGNKVALPQLDKFVETSFKTDEKSESPVIMSKGGVFYLVHVDNVTPERVRPLEEVRAQVIDGWQKEQRSAKLHEIAQQVSLRFMKPDTRDAAISEYHLQPVAHPTLKRTARMADDIPLPPPLVSDIFSHKPNGATDVYPIKGGDYLIAVVESIVPAPAPAKDAKELTELRQQLQQNVQDEILTEYAQYLSNKYTISIHQNVLDAVTK